MIRIPHSDLAVPAARRAALVWRRASEFGLSGLLLVGSGIVVSWGLRGLFGLAAYPVEVSLSVAILLALCVTPMVRSARAGTFDIFDLAISFGGIYFLYFGLRALILLFDPGILTSETPHPSVFIAGLPAAMWYANVGMAAYLAGYRMSGRLVRTSGQWFKEQPGIDARLVSTAALMIYVLGWLARMPELGRGWFVSSAVSRFAADIPPTVQSISYFSILGIFGYALSLLALCLPGGNRPSPRIMAAVFTPLEFLYAMLIGSKLHLGMVVTLPLITYHYLRRRVSPSAVLITIVAFVFVIAPAVTAYRSVAAGVDFPLRSFGQRLPYVAGLTVARLRSMTPGEYVETSLRAFSDRLSGIDGVAATIRGVPLVVNYIHGESLVWVFKILVPTVLQPAKNNALTQTLSQVPRLFGYPDARQGGIAITSVAEFYWNFGAAGALIGMWCVGLIQGALVALLLRPPSPLRVFVYAILWPWMMMGIEGWAYFVYGNALRLGLFAVLVSLGIRRLAQLRQAPLIEAKHAAS